MHGLEIALSLVEINSPQNDSCKVVGKDEAKDGARKEGVEGS